jgi:hypothetical protein
MKLRPHGACRKSRRELPLFAAVRATSISVAAPTCLLCTGTRADGYRLFRRVAAISDVRR